MDTPAQVSPPSPTSSPLPRQGSFFTSRVFIIFISLFLLSLFGSGSYLLRSQEQSSSPREQKQPLQLPSVVSNILQLNATNNWETFTNMDYGYAIKYPGDLIVWGDPEYMDDIQFGEHIFITVYDKELGCTEYCLTETITATESATVGNLPAKKITGMTVPNEKKDGYYEPPQSFIRFEVINGKFLYYFEVYELYSDASSEFYAKKNYPPNREVKPVPEKELKLFEQMLQSITFSEPKRTDLKDYFWDEWEADYPIPSPWDEPWDYVNNPDFDPSRTPSPTLPPTSPEELAQNRDSTRRVHVNILLNAVLQYMDDHDDALPETIKATFQPVSSNGADLCALLTPTYVGSLPVDPLLQKVNKPVSCHKYDTGYEIKIDAATDEIIVRAPKTESFELMIQVSK